MSFRYAFSLLALITFCSLTSSANAQQPGDVIITEVLTNPTPTIDAGGEWFELHNNTNHGIDLKDWFVQDSAASGLRPMHKIATSLVVPAHGFVVLGGSTDPAQNGGALVDYAYGSALALANSLDAIRVVAPDGVTVIDRVKYGSASISAKSGISRELQDVTLHNLDMDGSNWVDADVATVYGTGGRGTPRVAGQTTGMLPVELVSFNAVTNGSGVALTWQTASETNNAGFEVQQVVAGDWHLLGFVIGAGTTAEAQRYRFAAEGLAPGAYRFRLRQVDFDGAFEYSPEVEVSVTAEGIYSLTSAHPNPFTARTQFSLSVSSAQRVRVSVFDVLGREVGKLHDGQVEAGSHTFTFEAAGQPAGRYVIRAQGERFLSTQQVTLVR